MVVTGLVVVSGVVTCEVGTCVVLAVEALTVLELISSVRYKNHGINIKANHEIILKANRLCNKSIPFPSAEK